MNFQNNPTITFNKKYCFLFFILLFIEIFIAKFVHNNFVRSYLGDVLVVVLLYCFIKSFLKLSNIKIAIAVLFFSYNIETLQYFQLVKLLGLQDIKIARIVIGTTFSWLDILCYTVGIILVLLIDRKES